MEDPGHNLPSDRTHPGSSESPDQSGADYGISVFEIASMFLRHRAPVLGVFAVACLISLLVALSKPTLYTSSAAFNPEEADAGASGAAALAQRFGVSLGSSPGERAPEFFSTLVTSSDILREVATTQYTQSGAADGVGTVDLVTHYQFEAATEEARIQLTIDRLEDVVTVSVNPETGIVQFSVTTLDPVLSQGVASRVLALVSDFDVTTRRSQARAERIFTDERLSELRGELEVAEDSLQEFLVTNRSFNNSPPLQFEHDRLQRVVRMRQELVTSVAQAYEQARIAEVRNTPVVTVIEEPRVPAFRDRKGRLRILLTGIGGGVVLATFAAFSLDLLQRARARETPDMQEMSSLWRATLGDLRRFIPGRSRDST